MIGRSIGVLVATLALAGSFPGARAANPPLVTQESFVYQGKFKVPSGIRSSGPSKLGFEYGGTAVAYNPKRDSLFVVGHDWDQMVAEITIPPLGSIAQVLQPLTAPAEGGTVGTGTTKVGGILPYGDRLFFNLYLYYDGSGSQTESLFVRPLDLSLRGEVEGPIRVGPLGAGFYSGYMAPIPPALRTMLGGPVVVGNCCIPIISRTSLGPSAFAFDPLSRTDPKPLVYYPASHPTLGKWDGAATYYTGGDSIKGVVVPDGYRSVLFFGRHGTTFCYGGTECHDPTGSSKGTHGYPYLSYVWAYDAAELARVASGKLKPWEVKPYAAWALPEFDGSEIGGAAFDSRTGRLFLSQLLGDGSLPAIHVYLLTPPPPDDDDTGRHAPAQDSTRRAVPRQ